MSLVLVRVTAPVLASSWLLSVMLMVSAVMLMLLASRWEGAAKVSPLLLSGSLPSMLTIPKLLMFRVLLGLVVINLPMMLMLPVASILIPLPAVMVSPTNSP